MVFLLENYDEEQPSKVMFSKAVQATMHRAQPYAYKLSYGFGFLRILKLVLL